MAESRSISQRHWEANKKQKRGLEKIFTFYAQQHVATNHSGLATFDDMAKTYNIIAQSDFLKLCKDFEMPLQRKDWADLVRRKIHRQAGKQTIAFGDFVELLTELFFQVQLNENKGAGLEENYFTRDREQDAFYLWKAHAHMHTDDETTWHKKLKSVR